MRMNIVTEKHFRNRQYVGGEQQAVLRYRGRIELKPEGVTETGDCVD